MVELPTGWVIVLNVVGWPVIHLSVAWVFTRLPGRWFEGRGVLGIGVRGWEVRAYERLVGVRGWKGLLPDGAAWMKGFGKRKLGARDGEYLRRFVAETRRRELAHWVMMGAGAVFLLWNPVWADWVMAGYAVVGNVPCIVVQRYNRGRIGRLLELKMKKEKGGVGEVARMGTSPGTG